MVTFHTKEHYRECPGCNIKGIPKTLKGFEYKDGKIMFHIECTNCKYVDITYEEGYYEFYGE